MDDVKTSVREFLSRNFRGVEIADDEDFFALGFVNSMFAMQLVAFVEKQFGITVEDEDIDINNFNTIGAIARLVARKNNPAV